MIPRLAPHAASLEQPSTDWRKVLRTGGALAILAVLFGFSWSPLPIFRLTRWIQATSITPITNLSGPSSGFSYSGESYEVLCTVATDTVTLYPVVHNGTAWEGPGMQWPCTLDPTKSTEGTCIFPARQGSGLVWNAFKTGSGTVSNCTAIGRSGPMPGGMGPPATGPGSGTVTSISASTGITLTPNPITTTGTVGITATGVTAAELLRPGLHWLAERRGARRCFIVGNDYVWPQVSGAVARALIRDGGGTLVGQTFLPYGARDYDPIFAAIRRTRADVVILLLLGQEAIAFSREFAAAGLDRRHLRFALATDETVLYGIGAEASAGLYITATYLAALRSAGNDGFLERYHGSFGPHAPTPNSFCQSCYDALHALAGRPRPVPRRAVHLAEADGLDFRVIASF